MKNKKPKKFNISESIIHAILLNLFFLPIAIGITVLKNIITDVDVKAILNLMINSSDTTISLTELFVIVITLMLYATIEELIFTAGAYKQVRKRVNFIVSVLITGMIFTCLHFPSNIFDFSLIFLTQSIIFVYYEKRNNILTAILAHYIHNQIIVGTVVILSAYITSLFI